MSLTLYQYRIRMGIIQPTATDGFVLCKVLEKIRNAAPRPKTRRDVIALLPSYYSVWAVDLVWKENRVRFDWVNAIKSLPEGMTEDEAWDAVTKGGYERSEAARLAFKLQWLHVTRTPTRKYQPRSKPPEIKREIATDGPKRRRFKPRDRNMHARSRWCRCDWCLGVEPARSTREARALREAQEEVD